MSKSPHWDVIGRSLPEIDLTSSEQVAHFAKVLTHASTLVLAAAVKRQFGDTLEVFRQNMSIVENVCKLLETNPIRRVVYLSSAAVYGEETENTRISEATPVNPTSYYGISKYAAERLLRKACTANNQTSLVCLRPPTVYGPGDPGRTYGPSGFSAAALDGAPITLWGDGTELREFMYIDDLCSVIEFAAAGDFDGELNVISGVSYSFAEVIAALREQVPEVRVETRARSKQKADNAFDSARIASVLPATFRFTSLRDGLARTLQETRIARGVGAAGAIAPAAVGDVLLDLGQQPVSNRFLTADDDLVAPTFPMELRLDRDTGLIHLGEPFPVAEIKPRVDWLTCFEPEGHLDDLAKRLTSLPGVTPSSTFGAYSFKDDTTLRRLNDLGYRKNWRLDPVEDMGISDACANVETYQAVLTPAKAVEIRERRGAADVLIVRHVIEHAYDLQAFITAMRTMVTPGGYIVWELPDCERALAAGDCSTVWEEHVYYFTAFTLRHLLIASGFDIVHFESVSYPFENSLVAIVRDAAPGQERERPDTVGVAQEVARAEGFAAALTRRKVVVRQKLEAMRRSRGRIALFGAGHLSVAFLSIMQVADLIDFVIDDNPHKRGLRMPVGGLRIVGSEAFESEEIRVCLLGLNPQNQPRVIASQARFTGRGGVFASIFPGGELDVARMT